MSFSSAIIAIDPSRQSRLPRCTENRAQVRAHVDHLLVEVAWRVAGGSAIGAVTGGIALGMAEP